MLTKISQITYAKQIVETLRKAGFIAYFAGGWVRDYLLKIPSEDIDIATNAKPEEVMALFPRTISVGASFGVVIVVFSKHKFEVATFRSDEAYLDGRRPQGILFSSPKGDAQRRDFTINGLFYDPLTNQVIDFVQGKEDLDAKIIRAIGNPHARFQEDRLRMIRAVRFAFRFNFTIEPKTRQAILDTAHLLRPAVAIERIVQELSKMALFPSFSEVILELQRLHLLPQIFPDLAKTSLEEIQKATLAWKDFPKETPLILFLTDLFPNKSLSELLALCSDLKLSNKERNCLKFFVSSKALFKNSSSNDQWVNFYAHSEADLNLKILAAKLPLEERPAFLVQNKERKEKLLAHIQRKQAKKPLITSTLLTKEGIPPGKALGILLEEAEKLAINAGLEDPQQVLLALKQSPSWPKSHEKS